MVGSSNIDMTIQGRPQKKKKHIKANVNPMPLTTDRDGPHSIHLNLNTAERNGEERL